MKSYKYVVVDVFTDVPLEGNPVAVFMDAAGMHVDLMQKIAQEMHLSETVFVLPAESDGDVRVRIFTPVNELSFAGHPTLGAAVALGELNDSAELKMETGMGTVLFDLVRTDSGGVVSGRMCQPVPSWEPYEHAAWLMDSLNLPPTTSTLPVEIYRNGPRHVFVGLEDIAELAHLEPDQRKLARLPDMAANCFAGAHTRWRLRMFSPAYGVVEDAATGSAAGALAVHLARHQVISFGQWIEIVQGVEIGRPSTMWSRVIGSEARIESVQVRGAAVIVARGALTV